MAPTRIDLVRRSYEVINSLGRIDAGVVDLEEFAPDLWASLAPDFELHDRPDLPDAKSYRGREESKEFWRKVQELFAEMRWDAHGFTDLGHAVVAEGTVTVRGRGSDVSVTAPETSVFWFRNGCIVRLQGFPTKADAIAAAERVV